MSLRDYYVKRDKFEPRMDLGYGFPCCSCNHVKQSCHDEPCRTCDHNVSAVPEDYTAKTNVRHRESSGATVVQEGCEKAT